MKTHADGSWCIVAGLPCPHPDCFSGGQFWRIPRLPEPLVNYRGDDVRPTSAPRIEVDTYKRRSPSPDMPFWRWEGVEQG